MISIMVGKCVNNYATVPQNSLTVFNEIGNVTAEALTQSSNVVYTPVEIATLVTFIVGVIQVRTIKKYENGNNRVWFTVIHY